MPNAWGSTPPEEAMGVLIHDFNQRSYGIRQSIRDLQEATKTPAEIARTLQATEKLLNKTIDEYYQKFQKDFKKD